jgi:hypothetical protein
LGILALIVNVFIAWIYGLGPPLGFLSISTQISIEFVIGIFVLCGVVYCIAWVIRRSQGIDLSLTFKEIPPQ